MRRHRIQLSPSKALLPPSLRRAECRDSNDRRDDETPPFAPGAARSPGHDIAARGDQFVTFTTTVAAGWRERVEIGFIRESARPRFLR